jgi:hypothetical protein
VSAPELPSVVVRVEAERVRVEVRDPFLDAWTVRRRAVEMHGYDEERAQTFLPQPVR